MGTACDIKIGRPVLFYQTVVNKWKGCVCFPSYRLYGKPLIYAMIIILSCFNATTWIAWL